VRKLLVLLLAAGCSEGGAGTPTSAPTEHPSLFTVEPSQLAHVKVVTAKKASVAVPVSLPALVAFDELQTAEVTPLVTGKVSKIFVHEGEAVKVGQPLLAMASPESSDAAANLARDNADLRAKKTILARDKDLYAHQAISLEELQQATLDVESAAATVRSDQSHVSITGSHGGDATLTSPIEGVVVLRQVAVGDVVQAESTPCFTITDPTSVWVVSQLYQEDLRRVEVGNTAHISSTALDAPLEGKVIYIGASIDDSTLTIPVRVAAPNPGGLLKAGMYVDTEIVPTRSEELVMVPAASVLRDDDNLPFVYVQVQPGQFARRSIQLGKQIGDAYPITQGLADGDQVLADGALFVQFADSLGE
jgi:cobalt-zinc-cadmium efflux system membrane fusion protein